MHLVPGTIITRFDEIESHAFKEKGIKILMARLDLIHPVISGNKLYKLHYFLEAANSSSHKTLITFGGAYSNHLAAAAFAGKESDLQTIAYVRGEEPKDWSHTLRYCQDQGMDLRFLSREDYALYQQDDFRNRLIEISGEGIVIPEGGYHPKGAKGAALIMDQLADVYPTHICTAVGTATTLAGLLTAAGEAQEIIAVPVIKNMTDIDQRIQFLTNRTGYGQLTTWDQYHFGGYAKQTAQLLDFMNNFYREHGIPLDMIYTAKMMYAVLEQARNDYFKSGSTVVCLHTGGLQGNLSLPPGILIF